MATKDVDERLKDEIMKSIGHEVIDKETLRHIAYYKAMYEGEPKERLEAIRNG